MKVQFWVIGKTTDHYLIPGIEEYIKRLKRYCQFEYIELPAAKIGKNATEQDTKTKEAIVVLEKIQKSDFLAVMDEVGKEFTSRKFADFIANHQMRGTKRLIFLIGGAYGFSNKIYERADIKIALSQMTFTHQMVRLIFTEQLYRAFTITKGEKYHH
ncbi:MAG: 23S rRNA (pseudouridine(1915)-N(3))-methyltransferase RlmH [Flavobacteriales bacterium]|nr:23S rRNA (pseudouridine(1915)-N(3))-methyltransferase RlmH [Flavobacteriales bacterium]|tara:strand:- start:46605 stop:47075 length:471 start_codon:yes stop_codon:yes gene_type:complete